MIVDQSWRNRPYLSLTDAVWCLSAVKERGLHRQCLAQQHNRCSRKQLLWLIQTKNHMNQLRISSSEVDLLTRHDIELELSTLFVSTLNVLIGMASSLLLLVPSLSYKDE